ncbi:serine hydrolase domain-containing protein [Streptomyces sp. URMC 123]|uniref:serine hydrolase domain-containing protein n=1 Tax=Streptomyces sp. URMC 123 TaxID=3423403 RepID=UPI003F1937EA
MTDLQGHCAAPFEAVRAAFIENFTARGELGAAVCVTVGGEPVVDLWGGWADPGRTREWRRDTLVNVWSTTKGVVALLAQILVEEGLLDLDAPVTHYWPEFGAAGKEAIPVRHLLSHRAGLAAFREPVSVTDLYDWDGVAARLAATEPWWEPGTRSGYHALTYGFLVGEVIRRIVGSSPGDCLRKRVTEPLGIDFAIGLPPTEDGRVAEVVLPPRDPSGERAALFAQASPMARAALANPLLGADTNTGPWRRAELPAVNGHGTARAVAQLYALLAGAPGGPLGPAAVERVRQGQGACVDLVLGAAFGGETELGLGCWLSGRRGSYGPNPRAFGHDGYGGSFGLADPEARLGIGYVMNRMGTRVADDPRKTALIEAVYGAL